MVVTFPQFFNVHINKWMITFLIAVMRKRDVWRPLYLCSKYLHFLLRWLHKCIFGNVDVCIGCCVASFIKLFGVNDAIGHYFSGDDPQQSMLDVEFRVG